MLTPWPLSFDPKSTALFELPVHKQSASDVQGQSLPRYDMKIRESEPIKQWMVFNWKLFMTSCVMRNILFVERFYKHPVVSIQSPPDTNQVWRPSQLATRHEPWLKNPRGSTLSCMLLGSTVSACCFLSLCFTLYTQIIFDRHLRNGKGLSDIYVYIYIYIQVYVIWF